MAQLKKRSVLPIYAVALVWVLFTATHSLCRAEDYRAVIILSIVVYAVARRKFPTVTYELPDPPPVEDSWEDPWAAAQAAPQAEPEPPQDPKIRALMEEKARALAEMRRLNDAILDPVISQRIDQLEDATEKILTHVAEHPEKLPQIRKLMTYYLPTTLKILNAYDRMGSVGVQGKNIDGTMEKIEGMLETLVVAYHKQLDALFQDEAMDIASDITVMENLLAQEGLSGKPLRTNL